MLQTFTYSTGLAFTGRSAACAPATATRPAAEPRRRVFTIFIVPSKFLLLVGGFHSSDVEASRKVPIHFRAKPPGPLFLITAMRTSGPGRGDLGMPPSVSAANRQNGCGHSARGGAGGSTRLH